MKEKHVYSRPLRAGARIPVRVQITVASAAVVVVAGALFAPAATAAAPASADQIEVSHSADRSAPDLLDGSQITGARAIFVEPVAGTHSVAFYLDGARTPTRVEKYAPFDFDGTSAGGDATLTGPGALTPGTHTLEAVRTFGDGRPAVTLQARFTVPTTAGATRVITTCGIALCMDGSAWRLNGASTNGNPRNGQTPDGNIGLALQLGVNTVRLTDFISRPGRVNSHEFDESQWVGVDQMIAKAAANHLKVELDLSTFRNFLESQSATFNPYTYDWTKFLTFVANRRNTVTGARYGSDTTIAMVSFAGETEAPDHTDSETRGVTADQLVSFYDRVMTLWGKLAPQQLRIPGGLYFLTDSTMPWRQIFSLRSCDVAAIHSYSTNDENSQLAVAQLAKQLGKPWIVEEFGFSAHDHPSDADRAAAFNRQYGLGLTNGAAGVAWWNINPGAIDPSSFPKTIAAIQSKNAGLALKR